MFSFLTRFNYSDHGAFRTVRTPQEVARRAQEMIAEGALKEKDAESGQENKPKAPQVNWNVGDLEYEAYMRMLDSAVS